MAVQTLHYGRPLTARDAGVRALWWREYSQPHTEFRVVSADGVEIRGVHLRGGFSTLLVYCHGFSTGKNYSHVQRWVQGLAQELDVIAFDFRGHGESGGATTFGAKEVLDLDAVVQYAKRFDYERIVLMGSSMGGAAAVRYAADSKDVDAVITMGAYANTQFSFVAMMGLGVLKWSLTRRVIDRATTTRIEEAVPPYNPRDFVGRISPRPLLVLHGELDPLIPLSHARELLAHAGEPKTLQIIRRGGHDVENLNVRTKRRILEWLAETRLTQP
jgi:pimeloyl-ACP methyl ester carboxylesterase